MVLSLFDFPLLSFCNIYKLYRIKHLNSGALGPNIDRLRMMTEPVCQIISVTIKNNW